MSGIYRYRWQPCWCGGVDVDIPRQIAIQNPVYIYICVYRSVFPVNVSDGCTYMPLPAGRASPSRSPKRKQVAGHAFANQVPNRSIYLFLPVSGKTSVILYYGGCRYVCILARDPNRKVKRPDPPENSAHDFMQILGGGVVVN